MLRLLILVPTLKRFFFLTIWLEKPNLNFSLNVSCLWFFKSGYNVLAIRNVSITFHPFNGFWPFLLNSLYNNGCKSLPLPVIANYILTFVSKLSFHLLTLERKWDMNIEINVHLPFDGNFFQVLMKVSQICRCKWLLGYIRTF